MKTALAAMVPLFVMIQCHSDHNNKIDLSYHPKQLELFAPGVVSTNLYERDMAISPDGNEIIYTLSDYRQSRRCLVMIKKDDNRWSKKEILGFSGLYNDIEPFFSPDGKQLFFASDRPVNDDTTRTDYNIWVSLRNRKEWSEPEPLQASINTEHDEFFPSVGRNGNLYFTCARENGPGKEDIYLSRYMDGKYMEPEPLDTNVNSTVYEFNAYVSPEEDLILFSSYGRKDDLGGGDLYFSKKDSSGNWTNSQNMGYTINSDKLDYCPFIDFPRGNFYFTSERQIKPEKKITSVDEIEELATAILNGMGNIYRINFEQLMPDLK
jgi:hypothetical protein